MTAAMWSKGEVSAAIAALTTQHGLPQPVSYVLEEQPAVEDVLPAEGLASLSFVDRTDMVLWCLELGVDLRVVTRTNGRGTRYEAWAQVDRWPGWAVRLTCTHPVGAVAS